MQVTGNTNIGTYFALADHQARCQGNQCSFFQKPGWEPRAFMFTDIFWSTPSLLKLNQSLNEPNMCLYVLLDKKKCKQFFLE